MERLDKRFNVRMRILWSHSRFCVLVLLLQTELIAAPSTFTVATYNVENYLELATDSRPAKSQESKARIYETLRTLKADVLALQEIGSLNALMQLRAALKLEGLDYPHWEFVRGFDTNIHVAVLSKFPCVRRQSHTQDSFLLRGRRFRVSRGFADVDIQVHSTYVFTLITAHLKSRRAAVEVDETELREQEAALLREKIEARFKTDPNANLVVLGDFNDVKDSRSIKTIIGRGKNALVDTRPAEMNGDNQPSPIPQFAPRNVTWTHYYGKEDVYSRIDYILISRGMAKEWTGEGTYVLALPNWGVASDHRPLVASFIAENR